MQREPIFEINAPIRDRQSDKSLPSGVEASLAKWPAVAGHDDESLGCRDRYSRFPALPCLSEREKGDRLNGADLTFFG